MVPSDGKIHGGSFVFSLATNSETSQQDHGLDQGPSLPDWFAMMWSFRAGICYEASSNQNHVLYTSIHRRGYICAGY